MENSYRGKEQKIYNWYSNIKWSYFTQFLPFWVNLTFLLEQITLMLEMFWERIFCGLKNKTHCISEVLISSLIKLSKFGIYFISMRNTHFPITIGSKITWTVLLLSLSFKGTLWDIVYVKEQAWKQKERMEGRKREETKNLYFSFIIL